MTHTKDYGEEKRIDMLPTVAFKLSPSTLKVYVYWLDTCRNDKPALSNPKIAELLHISIPTVKRAHRELIAAKLLHREETSGQTSHTVAFTSPQGYSAYFDPEEQYFDFETDPDPIIPEPGSKIARPTNNVVKDSTTTTKTSNDVLSRIGKNGNGAKQLSEHQHLFGLAQQITGITVPDESTKPLLGKIAKALKVKGHHLDPTAIVEMWKTVVTITGDTRLTFETVNNIAQTVKELLLAVPAYTPQEVRAWAARVQEEENWKPSMITVKAIRANISKGEPIPAAPIPNYVPPDTGPKQTPEERRASYERSKAEHDAKQQAKRDAWAKEHPELLEGQRILEEKRNELLQRK